MLQRTSAVDEIHIDIVAFASTVQLGDASIVNSHSRALAVLREVEQFYGKEGDYSNYSIFSEDIPLPPVTEDLFHATYNLNPVIKVNKIAIVGVSNASILQVGNASNVSLEARVKHFRQLLPR